MKYMHEMGIEWFCGNEWKRKGGMGRRRGPARRIERIVVHMSGRWLVTIESRPLVTSQKTLREKKAHVSLFSLSERDIESLA